MDRNDPLHPIHERSPRHARQLDIEQRILSFCPDASEAGRFLAAVAESLTRQYGEQATEALLYASLLEKALERLDCCIPVDASEEVDEIGAFKDWRARREQ